MAFDDELALRGCTKVVKKRYFAMCDAEGALLGEVEDVETVDCNGNPIHPHILLPPGQEMFFYTEDTRDAIDQKIKDRENISSSKKEKR